MTTRTWTSIASLGSCRSIRALRATIDRGQGFRPSCLLLLVLWIVLGGAACMGPGMVAPGGAAPSPDLNAERGEADVHDPSSPTGDSPRVYTVDIRGGIHPGALAMLSHAIGVAEAEGGTALVVRLDTPGGLLTTTRDMVAAIGASTVPVVVYVEPAGAHAGSAGAFILLSAHVAAMHEGTNVGAATPVGGDGGDIEGAMGQKVLQDTTAFMRSIAETRGRDAETAERLVTEALSLTAREAREAGVIDLVVADFPALLEALEGRVVSIGRGERVLAVGDAEVVAISPRLMDRLLSVIAQPQIAHMLLSLGSLAIYVEIMAPGLAGPGIFGVIAVTLGLIGLTALPIETGFLLLLLLGIGLMLAEYFVAGFGVLGIGGAIAFVVGSLNLFQEPLPSGEQQGILLVSLAVVAGVGVVLLFLTGKGLSRLRGSPESKLPGKHGEAMVDFTDEGWVLVDGQRHAATTRAPLRHGDRIRVIDIETDGRLVVEKD